MTIDGRLHRTVAAQPYPLLFASISGARLGGFRSYGEGWASATPFGVGEIFGRRTGGIAGLSTLAIAHIFWSCLADSNRCDGIATAVSRQSIRGFFHKCGNLFSLSLGVRASVK